MNEIVLALIPALPLFGALVQLALALRGGARAAGAPYLAVATTAGSLALGIFLLVTTSGDDPVEWTALRWMTAGDLTIDLGLRADALGRIFVVLAASVAVASHLAFVRRARGEPGGGLAGEAQEARVLAALQTLTAAALLLPLAADLALFFVAFQGVALAAFLLVGSRLDDERATGAGMKAFVVARFGDAGLLLSIAGVAVVFRTLDFEAIRVAILDDAPIRMLVSGIRAPAEQTLAAPLPGVEIALATALGLVIVLAVVARAALVPLHVWLPDSRTAPAPAFALLAAAGLGGGILLAARLGEILVRAPAAMATLALLAAGTAAIAGVLACVQSDTRRTLAYVVLGHSGLALAAAGVGSFHAALAHELVRALAVASLGLVLVSSGGSGAMRRAAILASAAVLASLPPTGGFVTATGVLLEARTAFHTTIPVLPLGVFAAGLIATAALAAAVVRLAVRLLAKSGERAGAPPIAGGAAVLAAVAVAAGFLGIPSLFGGGMHALRAVLGDHVPYVGHYPPAGPRGAEWLAVVLTAVAALSGAAAGRALARRPDRAPDGARERESLLESGVFDRVYVACILRPLDRLTLVFAWIETRLVNRVVHGVGRLVRFLAFLLSRFQNGDVQYYGIVLVLGVVGMILWVLTGGTR